MCISRRTTQAMIVLKGLLSPLNGAISSGQMRCYVEQGRFHGENGGCETPSILTITFVLAVIAY